MPSKRLVRHPNLRAYIQLGFDPDHDSGQEHIIGDCVFCGASDKLYVNVTHKTWDCKKCDRGGGFQVFLQEIVKTCQQRFRGEPLRRLVRDRGLKPSTLKRHGIGYNITNDTYLIPVWDANHEKLWNVRIYTGKKMYNLAGCMAGLYGWDRIGDTPNIWLCEGEWDCMAMDEVLTQMEIENEVAVAVPGAKTFPLEWATYFQDRSVRVVYDNDYDREKDDGTTLVGAGKHGAIKVFNVLQPVAEETRFVHWPSKWKDGFDLKDYYHKKKRNAGKTHRGLKKLLQELPKDFDPEAIEKTAVRAVTKFEGPGMTPHDIYAGYRKWLKLPDTTVLDVLFGTVVGNRLAGDPLWIFLVAPSGGTKTELIMSIDHSPNIVHISSLTPNTLISGSISQGGGDPSLIPKLDGKILTIKDITSLLEMNPKARDDIFGQLRDAYDGEAAKPFGTGVMKKYVSKFGIIAGVTPAIELYTEGYTALGERFLRYRLPVSRTHTGKMSLAHRAVDNLRSGNKDGMRAGLREVAKRALDHEFGLMPEVPKKLQEQIVYAAYWTCMMRGSVTRDKYTKEILYHPYIELPTRLSTQYTKLAMGVAMFRRAQVIGKREIRIVLQMARGTVPTRHEITVRKMWKSGRNASYSVEEVSKMIGLPGPTTWKALQNLDMLNIVRKAGTSKIDVLSRYVLTEDFIEITSKGGLL